MAELSVCFPEVVRIWPRVGFAARSYRGGGGALRLYVIAKAIAREADGVSRDQVLACLRVFGVAPWTAKRWLDAARKLGLVQDVQRQSGEWSLRLIGYAKAALLLGLKQPGKPVEIPTEALFGRQWWSRLFAAFEGSFQGRPISRRTLQAVSGIPLSTQRVYDNQAGVVRRKNYALSAIPADHLDAVKEFGKRAAPFAFLDKSTNRRLIGWRLPDSRSCPMLGIGGPCNTAGIVSLFNRTSGQLKRTQRRLSRSDSPLREVYLFSHTSRRGADLWLHVPLR